jgi:hypothetical protein
VAALRWPTMIQALLSIIENHENILEHYDEFFDEVK